MKNIIGPVNEPCYALAGVDPIGDYQVVLLDEGGLVYAIVPELTKVRREIAELKAMIKALTGGVQIDE